MSTTATKSPSQPSSNGGAAGAGGALVLAGSQGGLALIPQPTPLTRLNYFDGKFLRADDLRVEQDYLRNLAWLGNRAGGSGVIYGFDLTDDGAGKLALSAGLAIDPQGRVLSLPHPATVDLAQLIAESRKTGASSGGSSSAADAAGGFTGCELDAVSAPGTGAVVPTDLYLIVAQHAEALCGQADVYGKLCEDACITSTDRPYRLEGIVLRALPLPLPAAPCTASWLTRVHRRSQVASAYFADERTRLGREMSGTRLRQEFWCLGATEETGDAVPLAVVSLASTALEWVDEWIARRERMSDPPLRWWQWQTGMRPLAVFWAQVLQFQCQLADSVANNPTPGGSGDPCAQQYSLLQKTQTMLAEVERQYREMAARAGEIQKVRLRDREKMMAKEAPHEATGGMEELEMFRPDFVTRVADLQADVKATLTQIDQNVVTRVLIEKGITELPAAGWLPVAPGPLDVNTQVRRLLGDGVDLRFCAVRPDFVPHALEEAQHMERICLLQGLSDPNDRPEVDVLVPDGTVVEEKHTTGIPMETWVSIQLPDFDRETLEVTPGDVVVLTGASRVERLESGGGALHFAAQGRVRQRKQVQNPTEPTASAPPPAPAPAPSAPQYQTPATEMKKYASVAGGGTDPAADTQTTADKATSATATGGTATGSTGDGTSTGGDFVPSLWATLRTDGDPFALKPGDTTAVRGDVVVTADRRDGPGVAEVHLQGELECLDGGGGQPLLRGRAEGTAILTSPGGQGEARFLTVPVEMALNATAGGGAAFTLTFRGPDDERVTLTAGWGQRPLLGTAKVEMDWIETILHRLLADATTESQKKEVRLRVEALKKEHPAYAHVPIAGAKVRESAGVEQAGNPYHDSAVQGLAALEALLARPGFRTAAEGRLFPAPKVTDEQPRVLATRDWVLFHRRRRSSCDCRCHPVPAVAARRYRLYHVRAPFDATVDEIRRTVGGIQPVEGLQTLGVLPEFVQGGATLATPRASILEAWKQVHPGGEIVYGAVCGAGEGAGDPPAVQDARLEAVSSIADDETPDAQAVYEVLASVPPALPAGGVDGVIVLVTRDAVTTVCHQAYRLPHGTYIHQLQKADPSQLAGMLKQAHDLGTYRFQEGSATPVDDLSPIAAKWDSVDASTRPEDAVLLSMAPAGGTLQTTQIAQSKALMKAVGALKMESFPTLTAPVSADCDVVTVISEAVPIPCQEVWRVDDGMDATGRLILPQVMELLQGGNVEEARKVAGVQPLGSIRFYYTTADLQPAQQVPWKEGDAIEQVITATIGQPLPDETMALHEQRSQAIGATLKDAAGAKYAGLGSGEGTLGCSAVTLLVHPVPVQDTCMDVIRLEEYPSSDAARRWFRRLVGEGDVAGALKLPAVQAIATVQFNQGDPTILGDGKAALEKAWSAAGPVQPLMSFIARSQSDDSQSPFFRAEMQAVDDVIAPGVSVDDDAVAPAGTSMPGCPVVGVVVGIVDKNAPCNALYLLNGNLDITAVDGAVGQAFFDQKWLDANTQPLHTVMFNPNTGAMLDDPVLLKEEYQGADSNPVYGWRSIVGPGGDAKQADAQSRQIVTAIASPTTPGRDLQANSTLPGFCGGITIVGGTYVG